MAWNGRATLPLCCGCFHHHNTWWSTRLGNKGTATINTVWLRIDMGSINGILASDQPDPKCDVRLALLVNVSPFSWEKAFHHRLEGDTLTVRIFCYHEHPGTYFCRHEKYFQTKIIHSQWSQNKMLNTYEGTLMIFLEQDHQWNILVAFYACRINVLNAFLLQTDIAGTNRLMLPQEGEIAKHVTLTHFLILTWQQCWLWPRRKERERNQTNRFAGLFKLTRLLSMNLVKSSANSSTNGNRKQ